MSTRKFLISIVLVFAMLILVGTTNVNAANFNLIVDYDGSTFELEVSETTLVSELKTQIKEAKGIEESKQILFAGTDIFAGRVLEDSKMLSDYNITGDTLTPGSIRWVTLRELDDAEKNYTCNSIKPSNIDEASIILMEFEEEQNIHLIYNYADETQVSNFKAYTDKYYYSNITITYKYDENIKKIVDKITEKISKVTEEQEIFDVKDFEIVNYWANPGEMFYYSSELMSYLGNKNFEFNELLGSATLFTTENGGPVTLKYNGTVYYVEYMLGVEAKHILYVPTDTAKADYLKVMQERVDNYLGKGKAVVKDCGTIESFIEEHQAELVEEVSQASSDGHVYEMIIDEESYYFVINANTEKMYTPIFTTSDVATDVEISSNNGELSLDTLIKVNEITNGEQYDKILKILGIENGEMYDLKLFSQSLNKNITKLEDGSFEVRIPLSEKFKNKELIAYYVDDNGAKEEHTVTVKDGYAIFNTNHFSVYTLAEKPIEKPEEKPTDKPEEKPDDTPSSEENTNNEKDETPKTGYSVNIIIVLAFFAVVGLGTVLTIKKQK